MNKIINLVFTIILLSLILLVYLKIDEITDFFTGFMFDEKTVEIKEKNEYARDFYYVKFQNDDKFIPVDKESILNIFYNIFNNGYDEFTFYCPSEYEDCIDDVKTIANDNVLLSKVNDYVHPFNSIKNLNTKVSSDGTVIVSVSKNYTSNEIDELNKRVSDILYELNIDDLSDNVEKIRSIHNYIIKNVEYDEEMANNNTSSYRSNTAYGALVQGYAICSGYADVMEIFLERFNIKSFKVASDLHVWNSVFIDNTWKQLDLTWDDPITNTGQDYIYHKYFLVDAAMLPSLDTETNEHDYDPTVYLEI